jgi:hypothetical protein
LPGLREVAFGVECVTGAGENIFGWMLGQQFVNGG